MTGGRVIAVVAVLLAVGSPAGAAPVVQAQTPLPTPPFLQQPDASQQQFDQAKALFDAFEYAKAIAAFDELLVALMSAEVQRPDMLAQVLEMRARAKFALGDTAGVEQDFAALLAIQPGYRLAPDVSPRVIELFDRIVAATVGQVTITMTPPGDLDIDRNTYTIPTEGLTIDLTAGDHQLTVERPNFAPVSQPLTITAGEARELALRLERVSASLEVQTEEPGVEVLLDGTPRGTTEAAAGGVGSLMLNDLPLGSHRLVLRRECFLDAERTISLVADDLRTDPIGLESATAAVTVRTDASSALMYLDGEPRGPAPGELTICQGEHVVEVRGPSGRFVERREWRAGETAEIDAVLRSAFAIVSVSGDGEAAVLEQLRADVARVLAPAAHVLVYRPDAAEVQAAMQAENVPEGWLANAVTGSAAALPGDVIRDMSRRLAARLGVQGFAAVVAGAERFQATVGLLAAGSREPEVLAFSTADQASQRAALDRVGAPLPLILRPSIGSAAIDVMGAQGPVIVRVSGPSADAGLVRGDMIIGMSGRAVGSVAGFRAALADADSSVTLDVVGPTGETRQVTVAPVLTPDVLPLRDRSLLYNRALLELQERTQTASSPAERAAAHLNLAVVLLRVGSFDEALQSLGQARLEDGPGVSSGTVAYLRGLALEGLGQTADAQAAFAEAAGAPEARLGLDGPLVAPLARQKMGSGR
jgi:tetratricopeptide (TPR) repeat protein